MAFVFVSVLILLFCRLGFNRCTRVVPGVMHPVNAHVLKILTKKLACYARWPCDTLKRQHESRRDETRQDKRCYIHAN